MGQSYRPGQDREGGQYDCLVPLDADWLTICRRITKRQADLFAEFSSIGDRTVYDGTGEGGDRALVIDRQCEDIVFDELEALAADGYSFTAVSEERGEVRFGTPDGVLVVIDPIDGSMNARRTLPSHSLSIAVADGSSMADCRFGFVHDFGANEEFAAWEGKGATLNGDPMVAKGPGYGLEVVGLESAEPSWIGPVISALEGKVYRLRAVGSIAISLSYVAAGRFDGMLCARPCRSVDAAAAQLIAREAGAMVEFAGLELGEADLGLEARYLVAGAGDAEMLATVRASQDAAPEVQR